MDTTQQFLDAIKAGNKQSVIALLATTPELVNTRTADGVSAVLSGLYHNKLEITEVLLAHHPDLDIFDASATGQRDRVVALLDAQPDLVNTIASDGFSALGLAAFFNQPAIVEVLLTRGADVNFVSRNPLHVMPLHSAVAAQSVVISKLLLDHGADVNAEQADRFTPLQGAAQSGNLELVKLLLSYGADRDATNANGQTALSIAHEQGYEDVVMLLCS
jgi:ankyrin repeat protein